MFVCGTTMSSTSAEKLDSNDSQGKPKGEASKPTGTEKQNTTLRGKEKDGAKATKASDNATARDPNVKYFSRLGIVHRSEAYPQSSKRISMHAGLHNRRARSHSKNVASGKSRRAATVVGSNVVAASSVQEGGGVDPAHRGSATDDAPASTDGGSSYFSETLPATTDAPQEGNEDISVTQSDADGRVAGNVIVRSTSLQALWGQPDVEMTQLPNRNKWLSMADFSSLLSQNRFHSGLEQIQNETAYVKAGLLVEPGTSSVIVHHEPTLPRSRTRSSSQPPKSGTHYMESNR